MIKKLIGRILNILLLKNQKILQKYGFIEERFPSDMEKDFKVLFNKCKDYTFTSKARMFSLYDAIKYIVNNKIPGDIVECGVW